MTARNGQVASGEEELRILRMVEAKTISAEEASALLAVLEESAAKRKVAHDGLVPPRWVRVRVSELGSGKDRVNVTMPLSLVDVGLKMGARLSHGTQGRGFADIAEAIRRGAQGKVFDAEDTAGGERVEIYLE